MEIKAKCHNNGIKNYNSGLKNVILSSLVGWMIVLVGLATVALVGVSVAQESSGLSSEEEYVFSNEHNSEKELIVVFNSGEQLQNQKFLFNFRRGKEPNKVNLKMSSFVADGVNKDGTGIGISGSVTGSLSPGHLSILYKVNCDSGQAHGKSELKLDVPFNQDIKGEILGFKYNCHWKLGR